MADDSTILRTRLRSCIDSILDLEEGFRARGQGDFFGPELARLKAYATRVGHLPVDEPTVAHLEALTADILSAYGPASGSLSPASSRAVQ